MKKQSKCKKPETGDPAPKEGVATILKRKPQHPAGEQIRQRAHQISQTRGGAPGRELDDWLQAERELKQELSPQLQGAGGSDVQKAPGAEALQPGMPQD